MGLTPRAIVEDDYEASNGGRKSSAVLKELSGMRKSLNKAPLPASPDSTGEPLYSASTRRDKSHIS